MYTPMYKFIIKYANTEGLLSSLLNVRKILNQEISEETELNKTTRQYMGDDYPMVIDSDMILEEMKIASNILDEMENSNLQGRH